METAAAHCVRCRAACTSWVDGVDSILVTPMTYAARGNGMMSIFRAKSF
ncbi:MAG: hypothetical protein ACLSDM_07290 [Butyricicoccus sp.]